MRHLPPSPPDRPAPRRACTSSTAACDFWNWGEGTLRPACCTEHLLELTTFASELLTRHGIDHWLDYGSLLGAVRDGRLIPWDADVDFGMRARDAEAVTRLADAVAAAGHRLDTSLEGVIRFVYSEVNDAHVDVFLWEERDEMLLPLEDLSYAWPGMASRLAFPLRFVEPLGQATLHGRSFPAPQPAPALLRDHRYGPDWEKPARPIRSVGLYPSFDLDEMTPELEHLLERIAAGDERLAALRRAARRSDARAAELWQKAGLPISPPPRRLAAVRAEVPGAPAGPTFDRLAASVALLDQAIAEYDQRGAGLALRRGARRGRRLAEMLLARLQRRPHRAGFPFGVTAGDEDAG